LVGVAFWWTRGCIDGWREDRWDGWRVGGEDELKMVFIYSFFIYRDY